MSLLRKTPTCPVHGCALVLSHHGKKSNLGHYFVEVVGAPLLYCPQCLEKGQDTSVEVEPAASNAFLKRLVQVLETSEFPGLLNKPKIRVDFNPTKTTLEHPYGQAVTTNAAAMTQPNVAASPPEESEETRLEGIEPLEPRHTLDQLILDQDTLERIREATNVLVSQDLIYVTWGLCSVARTGRRVALNFYGPPGTGKTLAADAIADLLAKKILRISYAELESKYVGETPKNIKAAFAKASETGALLFFDEADSILGKRLVNVSQSADNSINVARSTTLISSTTSTARSSSPRIWSGITIPPSCGACSPTSSSGSPPPSSARRSGAAISPANSRWRRMSISRAWRSTRKVRRAETSRTPSCSQPLTPRCDREPSRWSCLRT